MNGSDQLFSGWESKYAPGCKEQLLLQFDRPDLVNISFTRNFMEGDRVSAGDTIALIYSDELNFQYNSLKAELKKAKTYYQSLLAGSKPEELDIAQKNVERSKIALETAKQNYERAKVLEKSSFTSLAEYQSFEGIYKLAQADLELALSQLYSLKAGAKPEDIQVALADVQRIQVLIDNLKRRIERHAYIISPINGIALFDSTVDYILRIESTDTLAAEASFPEVVANFIQPQQQIQIKLPAQKDFIFLGQISQVVFLKGNLSGIVVTALIDNRQNQLKNGMTGRAVLTIKDQPLFTGLLDKLKYSP